MKGKNSKNRRRNHFALVMAALFYLILWITVPSELFAAPVISAVSGTLTNGQSITITGTGFGATGPVTKIFDDFQKGTNGNPISLTAGSATVNQWWRRAELGDGYTRYTNVYAHSGTIAARQSWGESGAAEPNMWIDAALNGATEVYASFWIMIPVGGHVPGENVAGGANWKVWVISGEPFPESPYESTILLNVADWPMTGFGFLINNAWYDESGRDYLLSSQDGYHDSGSGSLNIAAGVWHRLEMYNKGGTSNDGILGAWQTSSNQPRQEIGYSTGLTTIHPGESWDWFRIPAYGRGDPTSITYYDDVYVATGSGARARVEIGNSPVYEDSNSLAVMTVNAWSNSSVNTTARLGSFQNGQTVYLYVIDADGNVNSDGYPMVIGGSAGEDTTAPITSGHNPARNATNIARNTNIVVHVLDSGDGVDIDSLQLTVNREQISKQNLQITGSAADYTLTYDPPTDFGYDSVITVSVDAQDLHDPANVMATDTYSFTIKGLLDVENFTPTSGDRQVALSWTIPDDDDYAGVEIRCFASSDINYDEYPSTHEQGELVCKIDRPGNNCLYTEYNGQPLVNGYRYNYSAFSYDAYGHHGTTARTWAIPTSSLDTIDPTVKISSPTTGDTYVTEQDTVTLSGTASDNVGVTSVTWVNDRGGSGTASRTTDWTISNLPLHCGNDNIITVTARDAAGNTATDTLTVDVKPCPVSELHLE